MKLVILDTDALIHRGYHALPPLSAKGEPTNAIFGFFSIFIKMMQTLRPDYLIAAFDTPAPTFRKKAFDDYKAHRPKTPDELISQLVKVKELLGQIGILTLAKEGFEADDVIGTVATALSKKHKDLEIIIVTGDLDTLQLVQGGVKVYTMRKGMSDTVLYDKKAVVDRYGLTPSQLPDYKGLVGDASDNIPGVSGVGPKTASTLLQQYKNLETLFKAKDLPPKLQGKKDEAMFSKELGTINCNVPVSFTLKQAAWKGFNQEVLGPIFSSLGFSALLRRINVQPVTQESQGALFNKQTVKLTGEEREQAVIATWLLNPELKNPDPQESLDALKKKLKEQNILTVFETVEIPLMPILKGMSSLGIQVDKRSLQNLEVELKKESRQLRQELFRIAGQEFNPSSPDQLRVLLFDQLKLSPLGIRKTPGGKVSTKESELLKLASRHEVIALILKYRELEKLITTYIMPLYEKIEQDGRVHTTFIQTGAATGRLASQNPNLQNIPVQGEWASRVKSVFVAQKGFMLVSFDYSQIELRVAAHLSKDKEMLKAFKKGEDIHTHTASLVFDVPEKEVTSQMRRTAKVFNFGILYGLSTHGLSQSLHISREEAKDFIDNYFARFSGLRAYIDSVRQDVVKIGYVTTLLGRKRWFEELKTGRLPFNVREAMLREAVNMPIQGCLPYETKVLTSLGYKEIGKVYDLSKKRRPTHVWDGTQWRKYKVLNRGKAQLAEIHLKNGQVFKCDTRHIVLVATDKAYEWRKFKDIKTGDKICSSIPQQIKFQKRSPVKFHYNPIGNNGILLNVQNAGHEFWYWLGYYYGDGWIGKRIVPEKNNYQRISLNYAFGHQESKRLMQCREYFQQFGLRPLVRELRPSTAKGHHKFSLTMESRGLGILLERLGFNFDAKARTKRLPHCIYEESLENRKVFIKGLFDSDGWYGKSSKDLATLHLCQKELLEDTFLLLKTVGIPSNLRGPYEYKGQISYRLDVPRSFIFENILATPVRKIFRMGKSTPQFLIKEFIKSHSNLQKKFFKNNSDYVEYRRWRNGGSASIYFFDDFIKRYKLRFSMPIYDLTDVLKKKVYKKFDTTYTLSVEGSHRFDSEGIISKNTATGDIIKLAMIKVTETLKLLNPSTPDNIRLLLQIHDDLLFEIKEDKASAVIPKIKKIMESVIKLNVPLVVDIKTGRKWGQLK